MWRQFAVRLDLVNFLFSDIPSWLIQNDSMCITSFTCGHWTIHKHEDPHDVQQEAYGELNMIPSGDDEWVAVYHVVLLNWNRRSRKAAVRPISCSFPICYIHKSASTFNINLGIWNSDHDEKEYIPFWLSQYFKSSLHRLHWLKAFFTCSSVVMTEGCSYTRRWDKAQHSTIKSNVQN